MIYFYYGDDSFRAKETVDGLKKKFTEKFDASGRNVVTLYDDCTLDQLFDAMKTGGFFTEKKFIVLKNLFAHKKLSDMQDPLMTYLKTLKNTTEEHYIVFLQDGRPRATGKLFKFLREKTDTRCCHEFEALEGAELIRWITTHAKQLGKTIAPKTAEHLIAISGADTWALHSELQKLAHATDEETLTVTLIDRLTPAQAPDVLFPFLDAIGSKDRVAAVRHLRGLHTAHVELAAISAMLARTFRHIALANALQHERMNAYAIGKHLGLPPFIAQKIIAQSKNFSGTELERIFRSLRTLDRLTRINPGRAGVVLSQFVAAVTSSRAR